MADWLEQGVLVVYVVVFVSSKSHDPVRDRERIVYWVVYSRDLPTSISEVMYVCAYNSM